MDSTFLKCFLLSLAVMLQVGCATTKQTYDDTTPDPDTSTSHEDDSHGWGTSIQGAGAH
jgi:hypothetical protein